MAAVLQPALEAASAFSVTNIDDLFILMVLFSRLNQSLRAWHVVCGQCLGITALVAVSLLSLFGRLGLPEGWIGLLGLFPISLGFSQLAETFDAPLQGPDALAATPPEGWLANLLAVTTLTIANGSDNISVYMAMLANSTPLRLRVFPLVFVVLTGFWCVLAWWLTQSSALTQPLRHLQRELAPVLLVGIGFLVLAQSQIQRHPPLAVLALGCLGVMVVSLIQQLGSLPSRND
ncbi:MAG: cadmium resistance transporter [Cyanobacteriota bacterium]|nr:cadmium resistance transporter [Cyanobacteriota bacterium]